MTQLNLSPPWWGRMKFDNEESHKSSPQCHFPFILPKPVIQTQPWYWSKAPCLTARGTGLPPCPLFTCLTMSQEMSAHWWMRSTKLGLMLNGSSPQPILKMLMCALFYTDRLLSVTARFTADIWHHRDSWYPELAISVIASLSSPKVASWNRSDSI